MKRLISKPVSVSPSVELTYKCLICKDTGWLYGKLESGKPDFGKVIPCPCHTEEMAREKNERLLRYCQLPSGADSMTFETFEVRAGLQEAFAAAQAVANGAVKWLTLIGRVDSGKTHLAVAICNARLEAGQPARYMYVPLLLDELRDGYSDDSYRSRLQQFFDVPLLVLDDLGVTKRPSDWAMEKLNTIIDYRCINNKDLVVTMNCPINDIPGDTEGRIGSRLQRVRNRRVVVIEVPEYRFEI